MYAHENAVKSHANLIASYVLFVFEWIKILIRIFFGEANPELDYSQLIVNWSQLEIS